jgi:hypothetical protein
MVIKTLNTQNPFSDHGQIIKSNRFAGRKGEIQMIHNRVLGEAFGNIAIMGMPRIGKSSLAWNALIPLKDELLSTKIYCHLCMWDVLHPLLIFLSNYFIKC